MTTSAWRSASNTQDNEELEGAEKIQERDRHRWEATRRRRRISRIAADPFPRFQPKSRASWRAWLQKHHASAPGVLLVYAKKHTGLSSLDWDEAVEEALCFGWIDSKRLPLDSNFFLQIFTPRKPKSRWSGLNKKRVAALTKAGLMTPPGRPPSTWPGRPARGRRFDHVDAMVMPPDLKKALAKAPAAAAKFKALTASRQKQFLYFMNDAKKEETRIKRIAHILKQLSKRHHLDVPAASLESETWPDANASTASSGSKRARRTTAGPRPRSALTKDLSEDLREAWERLRETAADFGEQRIYASHNSIMFSRTSCYFFVRPKKSFLEVCVFLPRALKAPQVRRAEPSSKVKFYNLIQIRHRDEVEAPDHRLAAGGLRLRRRSSGEAAPAKKAAKKKAAKPPRRRRPRRRQYV